MIRILLAEHHIQVRKALRTLLEETSGYELVGEALEWEELLQLIDATEPDVVLLDWDFPYLPEDDPLALLNKMENPPRLIVISSQLEAQEEALNAGADCFVSKREPPEKLLEVLEMVRQQNETGEPESDEPESADPTEEASPWAQETDES